jgi:hypothetical protein
MQLHIVQTILGHYFRRHLGLVNGVAAAGSSVFTILLSFINQHLLTTYGVRNTPVRLTPVADLSPVSTTLGKLVAKFATGINDTGGNFAASVVDTGGNFADGVIDTGGKFAIGVLDTGGVP